MGLIGLVMVYTGCRTGEAAGLTIDDVRLEATTPYIAFRSNALRPLEKGGLERSVPIVEPLLSLLQTYTPPQDAYFGRYGAKKSYGNVSAQLGKIVKGRLNILDPSLVPYSTRHTFKDRGRVPQMLARQRDQALSQPRVAVLPCLIRQARP
jgi:integrase